jgi:hypothetical protein
LKSVGDYRGAAITRNPVMRSTEGRMSFKMILRRLVMAVVLGGYSVLGVGTSREKIESLLYAMNQSNIELVCEDVGEGDLKETRTEPGGG